MTNPSREEQLEAIRGKSLNDHIKEIEKEFDKKLDNLGYINDAVAVKDIKNFLTSKLREIATATLAACDVEKWKIKP